MKMFYQQDGGMITYEMLPDNFTIKETAIKGFEKLIVEKKVEKHFKQNNISFIIEEHYKL